MNIKILQTYNKIFYIILLTCFFFILPIFIAYSEPVDSLYVEDVHLLKGEIESIKVYSLTRISLENPGIADIIKADDKEITLIGKSVGQTPLFLWDEHGKRTLMIHVLDKDLDRLKKRIEALLLSANITEVTIAINENEGKLILSGDVPEHKKNNFDKIIMPFLDNILNFVNKKDERDLIQIDAEIIDVTESFLKDLGLKWTAGGNEAGFSIAFPETLPTPAGMTGGKAWDLLNIGDFNRTTALNVAFNAAITEGKAKVVSKPKLVVLNGESADFNIGGQYPITSSTTTNSTVSTSTTFKDYGVSMQVTPTIINKKIEIELSVDISDVDSSITVSDATAFTSTTLNTKLYLKNRQLIIIGGLIKLKRSDTVTRIPYISKFPIIGRFFSYSNAPKTDREIMISLRPTILYRDKDNQVKTVRTHNLVNTDKENEKLINFSEDELVPTDKPIIGDMMGYVKTVQQKIAKAITYPEEAKTSKWFGTVKLGLNILKDGTLYYVMIKESSGNSIIDRDALKTTRKVAPFKSFPKGATDKEINVVIPIEYSLK